VHKKIKTQLYAAVGIASHEHELDVYTVFGRSSTVQKNGNYCTKLDSSQYYL